jgi:hypothetical protein
MSQLKLTPDKIKMIAIIAAVVVVIWIVVEFGGDVGGAINSVLESIGVKDEPQITAAKNAVISANISSANPSSPFNPALYNNNPDASTLTFAQLQNMAGLINTAVSILPNWLSAPNGAQCLAAIKQCNNQVDVSNLAIVFGQLTNDDLYDFLATNLTNDVNIEVMQQIVTFVTALPTT